MLYSFFWFSKIIIIYFLWNNLFIDNNLSELQGYYYDLLIMISDAIL